MRIAVAAFAGALFALAAVSSADAQAPDSLAATAFDSTMREWMAKHGIVRGSVAAMRRGRLLFAMGYGGRGANERIAVWSMSKAVTALCIATLVQERKFRFDDPIGPLLAPLFARFGQPSDTRLPRITVAQLLTHRGGLPQQVGNDKLAPGAGQLVQQRSLSEVTVDMVMPAVVKLQLAYEPGAKHLYSNVGYLLLGQIVEAVTGQPYEKECGDRILAKAGIKEPRLDTKWGRLAHATAGWALSGPEYLAFARLLAPTKGSPLTRTTYDWLYDPTGKWVDSHKVLAYTLGVRIRLMPNRPPNVFHGGAWLWVSPSEKRGTWFVLRGDGVAWFASYDGVHPDTEPEIVAELGERLWNAALKVSSWPDHDLFSKMGIRPVGKVR